MSVSAAKINNFKFFFGGVNSEFAKRIPNVFYEKFNNQKVKGSTHDYSWGALDVTATTDVRSGGGFDEDVGLLERLPVARTTLDKCISFSPKIPYKLAAERSEAASSGLRNPDWRRLEDWFS